MYSFIFLDLKPGSSEESSYAFVSQVFYLVACRYRVVEDALVINMYYLVQ